MPKNSWGGCSNHLTALYARIEKGKQCMCRPWPGVLSTCRRRQLPRNNHATTAADAGHQRRWCCV
ncbi:hypothetical protein IMY05_C1213000200 [Salix suchowensis]|nr:hypothetical protein IMY05_C1213000200 [Salix suchowensis]